ncbi:MAG: TonB family protein [Gemmatimonadota bacterium]
MFESLEKHRNRKSVVQPMLALVVHAGLISLAIGSATGGSSHRAADPVVQRIPLYRMPESGTSGSPASGGTTGQIPAPTIDVAPDLPPLTEMATVPVHQPGPFDPRPFLTVGTRDSVVSGVGVFAEPDLTDPPRVLHLVDPGYPAALRQAGIEGAVTVTYVVDATGFVEPSSIRIVSSDQPGFAAAVVESVGKAQFTPGRVHGQAVRVLVRQVIRFAIRP